MWKSELYFSNLLAVNSVANVDSLKMIIVLVVEQLTATLVGEMLEA